MISKNGNIQSRRATDLRCICKILCDVKECKIYLRCCALLCEMSWLWNSPWSNIPACLCFSPKGCKGQQHVSAQHLSQAALYIVLMEDPPLCHTGISSPGVEWMGKLLCSNSSLALGHRHPVCHPLICLACHFIIHIECCGCMAGRSWIIS